MLLAAILFSSFSVTDWLFAPEQGMVLTLIRLAVLGILLGCFAAFGTGASIGSC